MERQCPAPRRQRLYEDWRPRQRPQGSSKIASGLRNKTRTKKQSKVQQLFLDFLPRLQGITAAVLNKPSLALLIKNHSTGSSSFSFSPL